MSQQDAAIIVFIGIFVISGAFTLYWSGKKNEDVDNINE